jgi:hypothetical protein
VNFEDYLISKKIDSAAFIRAEPERWKTWKAEFEQVHPNSFTAQKLYLINPLRRKYLLKVVLKEEVLADEKSSEKSLESNVNPETPTLPKVPPPANPKPATPKPVFKPKPKIN